MALGGIVLAPSGPISDQQIQRGKRPEGLNHDQGGLGRGNTLSLACVFNVAEVQEVEASRKETITFLFCTFSFSSNG